MATAAVEITQDARQDVYGALKRSKIARLKRRLAARKLKALALEQELKEKTAALRNARHADEKTQRAALHARQDARTAFATEQQHVADIMVALVELGEEVE